MSNTNQNRVVRTLEDILLGALTLIALGITGIFAIVQPKAFTSLAFIFLTTLLVSHLFN